MGECPGRDDGLQDSSVVMGPSVGQKFKNSPEFTNVHTFKAWCMETPSIVKSLVFNPLFSKESILPSRDEEICIRVDTHSMGLGLPKWSDHQPVAFFCRRGTATARRASTVGSNL